MIDRTEYERWLRDQPRERVFQSRSAGCCPLATFLREARGVSDVGVFHATWKVRPKSKQLPLPAWAVTAVAQIDGDLPYVTAARALQLVRGNP